MGTWDLKGKVGNLQVDEKDQTFGKFFQGHPETMSYRSNKQALLDCSVTFNLYYEATVVLLSFKQAFLCEFI